MYGAQVRAGRALLSSPQGELAKRAGISKQSVNRIESGSMDARFSKVTAIRETFRGARVEMGEDLTGAIHISIASTLLAKPSGQNRWRIGCF